MIFLKATHAELTRAGYKDLDPLHELFLLYRPDKDDDEEAQLSPRRPDLKEDTHLLQLLSWQASMAATQRDVAEREARLATPRASTCEPGALSAAESARQSNRAPRAALRSARLAQLGSPAYREEQILQQSMLDSQIDERMDRRSELQQQQQLQLQQLQEEHKARRQAAAARRAAAAAGKSKRGNDWNLQSMFGW